MKDTIAKFSKMFGEGSSEKDSGGRNSSNHANRRNFIKTAGGLSLAGMMFSPVEETLAASTQKVRRSSAPSELKITDLRIAEIDGAPMRVPIIRIDTNQGISGYGEVRDGGSARYALFLKSRILGLNPCNIEQVFRIIKQFGYHGRQGGGVSGVAMALFDLAGKAYNVPVYMLLGGKFRDNIRLYADTTMSRDKQEYGRRMKARADLGFTFLKMDFGIQLIKDVPGALAGADYWDLNKQWSSEPMSLGTTEHQFTGIQITDKGLDELVGYVAAVREAIGYDIPLASDHYGHFGVNTAIRLGQAVEKYRLAWLEDMIPWKYTSQLKEIKEAINTPLLTGEDIYLKEEFIKLIDAGAVDMVHPDPATSGGPLETKKIGDYAEEHGIAMAIHFAGTPISFMANVHTAAATRNFVALELHSVDVSWWDNMVTGIEKPLNNKGFARVSEKPGLGIELNEDVVKEHLVEGTKYFAPTPEWNEDRSWDRLWS